MLIQIVITIPIGLLWNVRIKTRQKLGIGAFLCLSVVMIIVAIIKASGIRTSVNSFNLVWELFWQQIEAYAAILAVSLTAFRSIFISNKPRLNKHTAKPGILQYLQIWFSSKRSSKGEIHQLSPPDQPNQTLPHVTLGSTFPSIQRKGLFDSQVQPISHVVPLSQSRGLDHDKSQTSEVHTVEDGSSDSLRTSESGSWEHFHRKESWPLRSANDTEQSYCKQWWPGRVIPKFSLSRTRDPTSEVWCRRLDSRDWDMRNGNFVPRITARIWANGMFSHWTLQLLKIFTAW